MFKNKTLLITGSTGSFGNAVLNRPQNQEAFMQGNFGFASMLLDTLKKHKNLCPVLTVCWHTPGKITTII